MRLKIFLRFLLCLSFSISNSYSQKLSLVEKDILKTVSHNNKAAIDFLIKTVNINSGTMNHDGVKQVGMLFKDAYDEINFETTWIDMSTVNRAGHLFAETKGTKGKRILLIGHLDTVFEEDSPFQEFTMINDSIAHAPGGNDMKGGDVIMLYALKALAANNLLDNAQIIAAYTGDEEKAGSPLSISRRDLIAAGKRSDIALGFENSTGFNEATIARRGSSNWKVETTGKRAHSSEIFNDNVGAGAIFEMSRILNTFYNEVRGEQYLTFNPGNILGGTKVDYDAEYNSGTTFGKGNVVAQYAISSGGLRFISENQKAQARLKIQKIVSNNLPYTSAKVTFADRYPAMSPTDGNNALLQLFSQLSEDIGHGMVFPFDPSKRGAADISFVANYVDCLDGLGTMGDFGHTPQETVNLNSIEALTQRAAILIYRLIQAE